MIFQEISQLSGIFSENPPGTLWKNFPRLFLESFINSFVNFSWIFPESLWSSFGIPHAILHTKYFWNLSGNSSLVLYASGIPLSISLWFYRKSFRESSKNFSGILPKNSGIIPEILLDFYGNPSDRFPWNSAENVVFMFALQRDGNLNIFWRFFRGFLQKSLRISSGKPFKIIVLNALIFFYETHQ